MRFVIAAVSVLALGVALVAQDQRSPAEEEIRQLTASVQDSWNAGSGQRFAEPFAADAVLVPPNGMMLVGREQIAEVHNELFEGPFRGSRMTMEVERVRFVRPEVAIVHIRGQMRVPDAEPQNSVITAVLERVDGRWSVLSTQVTDITTER